MRDETDAMRMSVVAFGTLAEETPEGQFRMDRVRRAAEAQERKLDELLLPGAAARLRQAEEDMFLGTVRRDVRGRVSRDIALGPSTSIFSGEA